eukprot:SAG31_NODE_46574_length_254_cov_0.503226_1_plen_52_part_10
MTNVFLSAKHDQAALAAARLLRAEAENAKLMEELQSTQQQLRDMKPVHQGLT